MTQSTIDVQAYATISYDDSINGLTQPYVVTANGQEIFRHATYAGCERFMQWHGYELAQEEETRNEQVPIAQLPCIGEIFLSNGLILKCSKTLTCDYAVVWDVCVNGCVIGEISMNYAGFWVSSQSLSMLTTPYEAILELLETAAELVAA